MMFFEKTEQFNLKQYFIPATDVRLQLKELFVRTKETVAREREISLEVVLLIGCLEDMNPGVNLQIGRREDLAKALGLTPNQYWKRAQAGRVLMRHPEFIDRIMQGKTHVSHVAILAPKITDANKDIFLAEVVGKSEKETRLLVSSVKKDGSREELEETIEVKLTLSRSQLALLERAKEVLSADGKVPSEEDVLAKALQDLLEKRDPLRRAERAAARLAKKAECSAESPPSAPKKNGSPSRDPIPRSLVHHVVLRDDGRCTFIDANGKRCEARHTLQIDHSKPVALGGENSLANLRLLCREHNVQVAAKIFGEKVMRQYVATI